MRYASFDNYESYPNMYYIGSCYDSPEECKAAVKGIILRLTQEYPDIEVLNKYETDLTYGCTFKSDQDRDFLVGTLLWSCKSHLRHDVSEKDWYVFVEKRPKDGSTDRVQRKYELLDKEHVVRVYDGLNFNLRKTAENGTA